MKTKITLAAIAALSVGAMIHAQISSPQSSTVSHAYLHVTPSQFQAALNDLRFTNAPGTNVLAILIRNDPNENARATVAYKE